MQKVSAKAKKPLPKCFIFKHIFEHVRHFSEYYAEPVKKLEESGYSLVDENKLFKTYSGGSGYEYICLVETDEQDYVVLCATWREYLTFCRNFGTVLKHLFQKLVPQT